MDLGTPGGRDGRAAALRCAGRAIPIIVLSAHAMPNDRHQALRLAAT
jgi:CheY-like chemotaxis protein